MDRRLLGILAGIGITASSIVSVSAPANAESRSEISTYRHALDIDAGNVSDAIEARNPAEAKEACDDLRVDAAALQNASRPRSYPKTMWRHLHLSAFYDHQAALHCLKWAKSGGMDDLAFDGMLAAIGDSAHQLDLLH